MPSLADFGSPAIYLTLMAAPDIRRMEWSEAQVVHCLLPAWERGEIESVSAPGSIALSFTTQHCAVRSAGGRLRDIVVHAGEIGLTGAEPIDWLRVERASELIEITAASATRVAMAEEFGVAAAADLDERQMAAGPGTWAIAVRFRAALRGGAPVTDVQRDALVRGLYAQVLCESFGGRPAARGNGALDAPRLARVTEFIEANLARELSVDALAAVAALSPFHFVRSFRAAVGVPPHRYVTMRRMERAREKLLAGAHIRTVVQQSGYTSRSWFAAAYRRHFGRPPDADAG